MKVTSISIYNTTIPVTRGSGLVFGTVLGLGLGLVFGNLFLMIGLGVLLGGALEGARIGYSDLSTRKKVANV